MTSYEMPWTQAVALSFTLLGIVTAAAWPFWIPAAVTGGLALLFWLISAPRIARELYRVRHTNHLVWLARSIRSLERECGMEPSGSFWD